MKRYEPMPDISSLSREEIAAGQRRIHGAALGYQPMRMKPVHFATSLILALRGRYYRLELLNKASVPRVAPKLGARVVDEFVAEELYPRLIAEGRITAQVDEPTFKLLRSHLNAAFNNDGGALGPGFAPYNPFGVDYSAPSYRYIGNLSKNHGYSGSFVTRILRATETGRQVLADCLLVLDLPPPPLDSLGSPLLDEDDLEWTDDYDGQFGALSDAATAQVAAIMAPRTEAIAKLLANLLRMRSAYALRYMIIGMSIWLFSYLMLRRGVEPLLLVDSLGGRNRRIRTQSQASYARELDRFANSYDKWRDGEGAAADDEDWEAFSESRKARKNLEDHFRDLGVRIGIVQPRAPSAKRKHIELQADTLRVLAMSILGEDEVITEIEFADRLRSLWCLCPGSAPADGELLRRHGFGPLDADEDLEPNARAFRELLIRLGLAVSPSDGLTLCALRADEVI